MYEFQLRLALCLDGYRDGVESAISGGLDHHIGISETRRSFLEDGHHRRLKAVDCTTQYFDWVTAGKDDLWRFFSHPASGQ
jgi:hypothetical protein